MADPYNEALADARRAISKLSQRIENEVVRAYAEMIIRIDRRIGQSTNELTKARGRALILSIKKELDRFARQLHGTALAAVEEAAAETVASHVAGATALGADVEAFGVVARDALKRLATRRQYAIAVGKQGFSSYFKTIIDSNVRDVASLVDDAIFRAVGEGITSDRLATELAQILTRDDAAVARYLKQRGARGGLTKAARRAIVTRPTAEATLAGSKLSKARTLLSRSRLIAQHEIASAFDEADKLAAHRSPVVAALKWHTSGAHPGLPSSPDECDVFEAADYYGMGRGVYPTAYAPSLLHPRCGCTTSKILLPKSQWGKRPKPPTTFRSVSQKSAKRTLERARTTGGKDVKRAKLTPARLKRITNSANEQARFARTKGRFE